MEADLALAEQDTKSTKQDFTQQAKAHSIDKLFGSIAANIDSLFVS